MTCYKHSIRSVGDDILLRLRCPLGFCKGAREPSECRDPVPVAGDVTSVSTNCLVCMHLRRCPTARLAPDHVDTCDVWQLREIGRWQCTVAHVSKVIRHFDGQKVGRDWLLSTPCVRQCMLPRLSSVCFCVISPFSREPLL